MDPQQLKNKILFRPLLLEERKKKKCLRKPRDWSIRVFSYCIPQSAQHPLIPKQFWLGNQWEQETETGPRKPRDWRLSNLLKFSQKVCGRTRNLAEISWELNLTPFSPGPSLLSLYTSRETSQKKQHITHCSLKWFHVLVSCYIFLYENQSLII